MRAWILIAALGLGLGSSPSFAAPGATGEWPSWRGPSNDGVSMEKGLISTWSKAGEHLLWRADITGRSTPVVFDGRVCTNGRIGDPKIFRQEWVGCYDAASGKKLWEHRFNVYHTSVPWNRVGWASVTGDPETGYLFVQGVGGAFLVYDRAGKLVWSRNLVEEFGFFSGFGGRTQTPLIDEDRVIVPFVSSSWAEWGPPRHRLFAFDKHTGELQWVAAPSPGSPEDLNSQSTPAVVEVDGRRLLVAGYSEGWIYATDARTGEKVWGFQLSKRSLNTSPVVGPDGTVYFAHSEENMDSPEMGRVVAINPKGSGDITKTNEKWRTHIEAGFSTPALHDGHLYIVDNSAILFSLNAATGAIEWTYDLGTVGKASAVIADGKIYVTEVNGRVHILKLGPNGAEKLSEVELTMPEDGRYAEIYGSFAIAYGRLYVTSEEGLYCLGDKKKVGKVPAPGMKELGTKELGTKGPGPIKPTAAPADAAIAKVLAVPAEIALRPSETATFRALGLDAISRPLGVKPGAWSLQGLAGTIDANGKFTPDPAKGTQIGKVAVKIGEVTATARVRVIADPPLSENFEAIAPGQRPTYFLHAGARFEVKDLNGNKVLSKGPSPEGIHKHKTFIGPTWWSDYTIQADLMGTKTGRKLPDVGLINSGYTVDLMGAQQQIEIRSWESEQRNTKDVPFTWDPDVWYTMKVKVHGDGAKSIIEVKVWKKSDPEPEAWTVMHEDPLGIPNGAPGLYGYSPTLAYYDNVQVVRN